MKLPCRTLFSCGHSQSLQEMGLEVIKLEYSLALKIKRNDWLLASARSQSLRFILSLRKNSNFITLGPAGLGWCGWRCKGGDTIFKFTRSRKLSKHEAYINYTDPKWKLYIVFKYIYFDDKLSFGVNFFGHRIFSVLSMSLKRLLDEIQKLHNFYE